MKVQTRSFLTCDIRPLVDHQAFSGPSASDSGTLPGLHQNLVSYSCCLQEKGVFGGERETENNKENLCLAGNVSLNGNSVSSSPRDREN